jgi:hypothetical protein
LLPASFLPSQIVLVVVLVLDFRYEGKSGFGFEKTVIDRTNRLTTRAKEDEDENDDENENDWGSGGRELRPTIAGIVCLKAIVQFKNL